MWFDPQADREKMRRGRRLARLPDRRGFVLQLADCHRDVQYFCDPLRRSGLRAPGAIGRSRLDPDKREPYHNRGITNFYAGLLSQAAADLDRSIWLDIVDARSNRPSQFARAGPQLEMTKWPAPVIRLYLGQVTPGEVLAAADNPDAATKQRRVCEANFFIGQMARVEACECRAHGAWRTAAKAPGVEVRNGRFDRSHHRGP